MTTATMQSQQLGVCAVITTFNYERFIADALDSVLAQTLPPDEIVVIDDGSTDNTAKVVEAYTERGVRYVYQENSGAGAARNRGLRETTSPLVAFLDADDMWLPGKLDMQVALLRAHPDAVMASGQKIWWDVRRDRRFIEQVQELEPARQRREICIDNTVGNPSMALIRREAIERVGEFDAGLRWGQDWELFIRLANAGRIVVAPEPVILYRWHAGGLSHENRAQRLGVIHSISRRAIATYEPRWYRLVLRLRAWSSVEFERARLSQKRDETRRTQLWHAVRALVVFPLSKGGEKAKLVVRMIIGEPVYQQLRRAAGAAGNGNSDVASG